MEPIIPRLLQAAPRVRRQCVLVCTKQYNDNGHFNNARHQQGSGPGRLRSFASSARHGMKERHENLNLQDGAHSQPAHKLSQNVTEEEENHYEKMLEHSKASQMRSPWMREGSDKPPVARQRSAGAMTKGMFLCRSHVDTSC